MDVASSLTMSFYRANATKPYAVVKADPSGCGTVTVSQYNTDHQITSSTDLSGGRQLSSFVAVNSASPISAPPRASRTVSARVHQIFPTFSWSPYVAAVA